MPRPRSLRHQQRLIAAGLRAQGRTWVEIAAVFQQRYRVNARVALRLAHGWSQRQAAEQWNRRWPNDPKTFKNLSYWEVWPAPSGYVGDHRALDIHHRATAHQRGAADGAVRELVELVQTAVSRALVGCLASGPPSPSAVAELGRER